MTDKDPYGSPRAPVAEPHDAKRPISWRRVVGWGALVFAARASIYIVSGFTDSRHAVYGIKVDDILAAIACLFLYIVFLRTTSTRHLRQLAAVFCAAVVFDLVFSFAFTQLLHLLVDEPRVNPIVWSELAFNLVVCLLAYVAWRVAERKPA